MIEGCQSSKTFSDVNKLGNKADPSNLHQRENKPRGILCISRGGCIPTKDVINSPWVKKEPADPFMGSCQQGYF